ncbi:DUF3597 domain-containing protein [Polyangium sorediatum]|uniref:Lipoprotein n=1 Tax=Polyangium sorediatum TaxID=889274 RepID=A0ABT6NWA7_9BACT|nr:DUF3597 domain-containing protein [Polyangium sorediatum]MDI1432622.1 hypothetical protein [Polyangium sorediatum]
MKYISIVGMVVLFAAAACGTDGARPPAEAASGEPRAAEPSTAAAEKAGPSEPTAKPSAPVNVSATLRPGAADLDVVFGADGAGITIEVWGVDGLKLTGGASPVSAPSVRSGQSLKVPVTYDAPTAESNLAVRVRGTFGGREQAKVQSFTINTGSQPKGAQAGENKVDGDGRPVKVMKSQ